MNVPGERRGAWALRVVAVAVVAGASFMAIHALARPLWLDDTHSTHHAMRGLGGVVESLRTDSHPPLYFWILAVWMQVGGLAEAWLRIPSVLFTLGAGLVLFFHGRRTEDPRLPWLFALFFLFNPVVTGHLQTVRPYALAGLFASVSTVLYLRHGGGGDRDGPPGSWSGWIPYVLVNVAGTVTHYWFFFLLAGQGLGALVFSRGRARRELVLALGASAVPFFALWTPTLLAQTQGTPTSWLNPPGGFWLLSAPIQLMGGFAFAREARIFWVLFALACIVRISPRPRLVTRAELANVLGARAVWMLVTVPIVALALAMLVSQVSPIYHVRYTIVLIPALALLQGHLLARLGDRVLVPILCLIMIAGSENSRLSAVGFELQRDNRAVAQYLLDSYRSGDQVVHVTLNYAPTVHYFRALAPDRHIPQSVFPVEVASHVGWRDRDGMLADTATLRREAADLVRSLAEEGSSGRLWLLADFDEDSALTAVLAEELEESFELKEVVPLTAWFVTEIRRYERGGAIDAGS